MRGFAHERPPDAVAAGMTGHAQMCNLGDPADGLEGQGGRVADAHRGEPDQMRKGGILGHENGGIRPRDQGLDFLRPARRPVRFDEQVRPPAPVELVKLIEKLGQPLEIA